MHSKTWTCCGRSDFGKILEVCTHYNLRCDYSPGRCIYARVTCSNTAKNGSVDVASWASAWVSNANMHLRSLA